MSYKTIAEVILLTSSFGLGGIVIRKIPALANLPEVDIKKEEENLVLGLKKIIRRLNPFTNFSYEPLLQKVLTKIRILSLKTDSKTFNWLQQLKEDAQKKKIRQDPNYWKEIKKEAKKTEF